MNDDTKKDVRKNLFGSPFADVPSASNSVLGRNVRSYQRRRNAESNIPEWNVPTPNRSPILGKNSCSKVRKRRKLMRAADLNMNSMGPRDTVVTEYLENKRKIVCTQKARLSFKQDRERLQIDFERALDTDSTRRAPLAADSKVVQKDKGDKKKTETIEIESSNGEDNDADDAEKETETLNTDSTRRAPLAADSKVVRKDKGDKKKTEMIEIESSSGEDNDTDDTEKKTEMIVIESSSGEDNDVDDVEEIHIKSSDTEVRPSDGIELEATQNIVVDGNQDRSPVFGASPFSCDQSSDETFFSERERSPCDLISAKPSQEISGGSSAIINVVEEKPPETALTISAETSPRRTQSDPSMQLTLLDSGKKRKKPKRGSLTEKLHSMINNQRSSVRLWRYQLRRTMETGTPVASVSVFVRECVSRLGRQFLEGFVVEDSHGLLSWDKRLLWIMIVPEITGKIEMKSDGLVQIFPPWEVLDDAAPLLNVAFIRFVSNREVDAKRYENMNVDSRKRTVIEEFDCPCLGANKMIVSCKDRFSRPNVIQRLFKHETR